MSTPKVLLVEDDSSIARFVQMALEELPIELVTCANVPDAMQALHAGGGETHHHGPHAARRVRH